MRSKFFGRRHVAFQRSVQQGTQESTEHAGHPAQPAQLRIMYIMSNIEKRLAKVGTWFVPALFIAHYPGYLPR